MTMITVKQHTLEEPVNSDINDIISSLSLNKTVVDNHNDTLINIDGVVVLSTGFVCPVFDGKIFCLNYLYTSLRDGKIHLSKTSVGGNLDMCNVTLTEAVDNYNREKDNFASATGLSVDHIISYIDFKGSQLLDFVSDDARNNAMFIIEHIKKNGIKYIDNHDDKKKKLEGYIVLNTGYVSPIFSGTVFCINRMYVSDDVLYLSRMSVAGNVDTRGVSIKDAIDKFNSTMESTTMRSRIIDFREF